MIYFDNNATTNMSPVVCKEFVRHFNMGNPSASHVSAKKAKKVLELFREEIAENCGFIVADKCLSPSSSSSSSSISTISSKKSPNISPKEYYILFTSGASESNSYVITKVCDSYLAKGITPHLVISSIEHKSVIECVNYHVNLGRATVSYVEPRVCGHIFAEDVATLLTPQTALVAVMSANNETGAINDVNAIGKVAHTNKVPFYTDSVQSFGKFGMSINNIDGFSVSFHKLGGPVGCGLLVLKREWVEGYGLNALIFGTQNYGMRGGTENVPAIAAARCAFGLAMKDRAEKNKRLFSYKQLIISELIKYVPYSTYREYKAANESPKKKPRHELEIVFFDDAIFANKSRSFIEYLPNTIFLSIVKRTNPAICNSKFKEALERNGVIISVGSACNTASPKASHVLYALEADDLIRSGALRISVGDMNTKAECIEFVKRFIFQLKKCI
jgi:cysteine desulfurase